MHGTQPPAVLAHRCDPRTATAAAAWGGSLCRSGLRYAPLRRRLPSAGVVLLVVEPEFRRLVGDVQEQHALHPPQRGVPPPARSRAELDILHDRHGAKPGLESCHLAQRSAGYRCLMSSADLLRLSSPRLWRYAHDRPLCRVSRRRRHGAQLHPGWQDRCAGTW